MVLEEAMGGMVVDARFEVTIPDAFCLEAFGGLLQELLPDTFAPVGGIDAEVEDHAVGESPVIRDAEQDETDDVVALEVK